MENKTPKQIILKRLSNVLKGQAMFIREDSMTPFMDRLQQLEVVETFKHFLDNYDEYKQVILQYEKSKKDKEQER